MDSDLFSLQFQLMNKKASPLTRRKIAYKVALDLFNGIEDRISKSAFFYSVLGPLSKKGPADDEDALDQANSALLTYVKRFPKALKEFRVYGVTDVNNEWTWSAKASDFKKDKEKDSVDPGKKERLNCDTCGAPLVRKGPARRFGWGLYRCDHCGSEYTIKE